jgi:uncharacterized protein YkwD
MKHAVRKWVAFLFLTALLVGCSSSSNDTRGKARSSGHSSRTDAVVKAPDKTTRQKQPQQTQPQPPPPPPPPKKEEGVLPGLEQQVAELVSAARTKEGFAALRTNSMLTGAARMHSAQMVEAGKLDAKLDLKAAGYEAQAQAQVVGSSTQPDAKMIVDSWLKDPMIRAQIMNAALEEAGVGIQRDAAGTRYYYSLVLATLKKP